MKASRISSMGVLCTLLLGCAQDFPQRDYSEEEQEFRETLQASSDFDSRLALARVYFEHNELDNADQLLQVLVAEDPEDAQALAWYGANNCKLAGRAQPWFLGLYKLYRVHSCLDQVREAAAQAPDDLTAQLVLVNTGAVVDMFGSLDSAEAALDKLLKGHEEQGDQYPPGPRAHVFLAAAQVEKARDDKASARAYLERVLALDANAATVAMAREQLAQL